MNATNLLRAGLLCLNIFLLPGNVSLAGDWPQVLGPQRNGIAASDEVLLNSWPASGPRVLWERPVGHGTAGLAVAGSTGILFHRLRDEEVTEAFDVRTAQTLWKLAHPTSFAPQQGELDGPLCVPVITGQRVITFGAQGVLTCSDVTTGKQLWQHHTHREYAATEGPLGAGSTPLVVDDLVIVNIGGTRDRGGIVAFSLENGDVRWKRGEQPASYSAPVLIELQGMKFVVILTRDSLQMLEPQRGAVMCQFPFSQRGGLINQATPVIDENRLLVTNHAGSVYGELDITGFARKFAGEKPLATQSCTPILLDGHYYAIDGREDRPPADLKCLNFQQAAAPASGAASNHRQQQLAPARRLSPLIWTEQSFGYGSLLAADGNLLAAKTDGELVLFRASSERFEMLDRQQVLKGPQRALPALSNGRLFVRDDRVLKCLLIGKEQVSNTPRAAAR